MENPNFDVTIIGTGLTESITAAALSKAGFSVVHIDQNPYYGGEEASLSLDEFVQWIDRVVSTNNASYSSVSRSSTVPPQSRQYSICLSPSIIPSVGPIISSLVSSGVAKYGGFRLLERVWVYHSARVIKSVAGTKEDVFKDKGISLIDKRRLMRFLMFAVGNFEDQREIESAHEIPFGEFLKTVFLLNEEMQTTLVFALAFCISPSDPTLPALHRLRRYLKSAGRYGPSSFLVGYYGGTGEIAQGFCRTAAVNGAMYVLGRQILSIAHPAADQVSPGEQPRYSITLDGVTDTLTSHVIISSASILPAHLTRLARLPPESSPAAFAYPVIARCIAIIDQGIIFPSPPPPDNTFAANIASLGSEGQQPSPLDAGIIVFPPSCLSQGSRTTAATVLITGEGTMSSPKGKWILYISLPLSATEAESVPAEMMLRPYLNATLAFTISANSEMPSSTPPVSAQSPEFKPSEQLPAPLFTTFYYQHPPPAPNLLEDSVTSSELRTYLVSPSPTQPSTLPEISDAAAVNAEAVFWETVGALREAGIQPKHRGGDLNAPQEDDTGVEPTDVESFWPAIQGDSEEDEW